jgi:hypothetical protein
MRFEFTARDDGVIDATVGSEHLLMNHALEDAVSSRAPRGAAHPGLSTYWIDRAENRLRSAVETQSSDPFATGNVTWLRLDGDSVVAGYEFDPDEQGGDSIPLNDFLVLLAEWRKVVVEAGGASGAAAEPSTVAWPLDPSGS